MKSSQTTINTMLRGHLRSPIKSRSYSSDRLKIFKQLPPTNLTCAFSIYHMSNCIQWTHRSPRMHSLQVFRSGIAIKKKYRKIPNRRNIILIRDIGLQRVLEATDRITIWNTLSLLFVGQLSVGGWGVNIHLSFCG